MKIYSKRKQKRIQKILDRQEALAQIRWTRWFLRNVPRPDEDFRWVKMGQLADSLEKALKK